MEENNTIKEILENSLIEHLKIVLSDGDPKNVVFGEKFRKMWDDFVNEKYSSFDKSYFITNEILNNIQSHKFTKQNPYKIFEISQDTFFKEVLIRIMHNNDDKSSYKTSTNLNYNETLQKLNYIVIDINSNLLNDTWQLEHVISHELLHTYEDFKRLSKKKKTLSKIFDINYINASITLIFTNNLVEQIISSYVYFFNSSEINAHLGEMKHYLQKHKFGGVTSAMNIIKKCPIYQKYLEIGEYISLLDKLSNKQQKIIFSEYKKYNFSETTPNQMIKKMTNNFLKLKRKFEVKIPKFCYEIYLKQNFAY